MINVTDVSSKVRQIAITSIGRDEPTLLITSDLTTPGEAVTCALSLRSHHPALIDAGFADLQTPIPWWGGRTLRFRFPATMITKP
jgi:hypothetical protein